MLYHLTTFPRERLRPLLGDAVLAAMVGQLFYFGQRWLALLADGDTGWQIRTGEWILQSRSFPTLSPNGAEPLGEAL